MNKHRTFFVLLVLLFLYIPAQAQIHSQLFIGSRSPEVVELQTFLATDRSIYPEGLVTGYFGTLTRAAVIRLQARNGLPQVGSVGPLTRALINSKVQPGTPVVSQPAAQPLTSAAVCNTALIKYDGYDSSHIISREACDLVNSLYASGKAAGNSGDTYENRDNLHVNLCEEWTPNPECPLDHRLFPQHAWRLLNQPGAARTLATGVTIGQASYAGYSDTIGKHSLTSLLYQTQAGADALYQQYTHNNLYAYPALEERTHDNIANTPYTVSTVQVSKAGTDSYRLHDASGSEFPFVKLALLGLASLQPDVKRTLISDGRLMGTLQMLIRRSQRSITDESSYLTSSVHNGTFIAHELVNGQPVPLYDAAKLVRLANGLTLADVPPLPNLTIQSETFTASEKLFSTPGAVARKVPIGSLPRTITVSAGDATNSYEWRMLSGSAKIASNGNTATITFENGTAATRTDVAVFTKKPGGTYYSVPGIVSIYMQ